MIKQLKNIGILMLSLVVIFATGGINIYKHYCFCTGETVQSFFNASVDCSHDSHSHACPAETSTAISQKACCADVAEPQKSTPTCTNNHQCCDDEYSFFKTDQYDFTKSVKKTFQFIAAYQVTLYSNQKEFAEQLFKSQLIPEKKAPPTYGIVLLTEINQLKIALPPTV